MRQRSFVFEHLAEVATIDPAVARRALDEMFGVVLWLLANALPDDFAALNRHAADIGGGAKGWESGNFGGLNRSENEKSTRPVWGLCGLAAVVLWVLN
jgi:hypothetical protein